jgi:hypothetical protein
MMTLDFHLQNKKFAESIFKMSTTTTTTALPTTTLAATIDPNLLLIEHRREECRVFLNETKTYYEPGKFRKEYFLLSRGHQHLRFL